MYDMVCLFSFSLSLSLSCVWRKETKNMKTAIDLITKKKLGVLIAINKKKLTTGIITDGQLRRANQHNKNILSLKVKDVMTKNPLSVNKDTLAAKSLSIMSENKITSLCVHNNKNKNAKLLQNKIGSNNNNNKNENENAIEFSDFSSGSEEDIDL